MGVEEEFIVVDTSNFFYTPFAPKALLALFFKDNRYLSRSSLESPFGRGKFSLNKKSLIKGFSIVEIKTSPQEDIDLLKDEIIFHRNDLIEAVENSNLALLPVGIHPFFSKEECGIENCAALHIHIDNKAKYYSNILRFVPQIIALTANSPFAYGRYLGMSSRALFSPSIGVPSNFYERKSDLIINRYFNTIELRVCDTQMFPEDVIETAATVQCIARIPIENKIKRSDYIKQRESAILNGRENIDTKPLLDEISEIAEELSLDDYVSKFFERKTGAELQYECFKENGLSTLITSLWASMKKGTFVVEKSDFCDSISRNYDKYLIYLILYSPIFMYNIFKKIRQDDAINTTPMFGRDPAKIEGELLFET